MKKYALSLIVAGAIAGLAAAQPQTASAGPFNDPSTPNYTHWQSYWDRVAFRDRHVMIGEVIDFHPYRVELRRSTGAVQTVDLKHGTTILPTGATPTPGEHIALVGYYSKGTFVVNQLIVR